jgi:hypothetical protein
MNFMFLWTTQLALGLCFTGLIASRIMAERALKLLSSDEKLLLIDSFSKMRIYAPLSYLVLVFAFLSLRHVVVGFFWPSYFALVILFALIEVITHRMVLHRLKALNINQAYQKAYSRSRYASDLGFLLTFIFVPISFFFK